MNKVINKFILLNKDIGDTFHFSEIEHYRLGQLYYFNHENGDIIENPDGVTENEIILYYIEYPIWLTARENAEYIAFVEYLLEQGVNTSLKIVEIPDNISYVIRQKYTDQYGDEYGPEYIEEYIEPRIWD